MRTNIEIDEALMAEAMKALGTKTKRETVEAALQHMVRAKRQLRAFMELKGIGWEGDLESMRTDKPLPDHG
ncbi:MAG TPA: type II toxin-antitoxin system VapB family antitoxin [Sphingomonas sp.]|jgi:Arc/MetJ family transcription regulator|uniref:type II toxin-antitoxin system VapB family antitoxin n=1 Tax=Sphingomonas sp. TaxID=28214 RepID=UPI002EDA6E82